MSLRLVLGFSAVVLFGCSKGQSSPDIAPSPIGPSGLRASAVANSTPTSHASSVPREVMVNMQDACDPDTFNAAIGPGTCVGAGGGVTFQHFIDTLTRLGSIGAWHFAPPNSQVRVGQSFLVTNHGGEVHTFTEVEEFGGGIVPMLNDLAHVPNVAPECKTLEPDDFVAPGATYKEDIEEEGVEKYQCCIHPWMHLVAHVSDK